MQQLLTFQGLVEKYMHELTQPLLMVLDFLLSTSRIFPLDSS